MLLLHKESSLFIDGGGVKPFPFKFLIPEKTVGIPRILVNQRDTMSTVLPRDLSHHGAEIRRGANYHSATRSPHQP